MKPRKDDFQDRRKHLENLNDEELKDYFFKLTDQLVNPLLDLAYNHTTKAIERSVVMRMGFSSLESNGLIEKLIELDLLKYGAGHILYLHSKINQLTLRDSYQNILLGININEVIEELKK